MEQTEIAPAQTTKVARSVVAWAAILWVGMFYAGLMGFFGFMSLARTSSWSDYETPWVKLIFDHTAAILGIPLSCAAALFVVLFVESHLGQMELKALGFEFKGSAAPVVMWIACFLALVIGIRVLW